MVMEELVLFHVLKVRSRQPCIGVRKLHAILSPVFKSSGIKVGRDKLYMILKKNNMLVKPRRRYIQTTDSTHGYRKYANIIEGYEPSGPEQIWASDITYVRTRKGFVFVSLVTDWYSKKKMGHHVHSTLSTKGPLKALRMALQNRAYPDTMLIHHSDRGTQYCSKEYIDKLQKQKIQISMSRPGNPYENAVAERVNGTLKHEYFLDEQFNSLAEVRRTVKEAVDIYNNERPHASCDYLTPNQAHMTNGILTKRWRTYKRPPRQLKLSQKTVSALEQLVLKNNQCSILQSSDNAMAGTGHGGIT